MACEPHNKETLEVLSFLPPYEGKIVLKLGVGIGRFTSELAKKAGKVIVLDSKESESKKNNGHHEKVEYMCADVTSDELSLPPESMDLIFSNSLFMHLSHKEVEDTAKKLLKWVKVGGYIFFMEPCSNEYGDDKQNNDSEHFREPKFYTTVFKDCRMYDASSKSLEFSLVGSKCIGANEHNKKEQNQICWIWQKVNSEDDKGLQQFLDNIWYKNSFILCYERILGQGFLSIGGIDTTKEFVSMLDLKAGQKVLDVGCGIGGGTFYMAKNFDVDVLDNTFDAIYSRETILHIQDKPALFQRFYKWLKPGGKVLISDYCRKAGTSSPGLAEYIKQRRYDICDIETYGQMLKDAGFGEVKTEDRTEQFEDVLQKAVEIFEKEKEKLTGDLSEEAYNYLVDVWKGKLNRTRSGEQRWGLFFAKKR